MILENYETRLEWLTARKNGIGASDSAQIFQGSEFAVYAAKIGHLSDDPVYWPFLRGHAMEGPIADWLAKQHDVEIVDPGEFSIARSEEHSHVFASIDRIIRGDPDKVLEIKSWSGMQKRQWDNGPPLHVQIQVQHELYVMGLDHGVVAVSIGGAEPECFDVVRNERFIKAMLTKIRQFWERVQERRPPDPDDSEASRTAIGKLYGKPNGTMVAFPEEFAGLDDRLLTAKESFGALKAEICGLENKFKAAIGNHTRGVLPGGVAYTLERQTRAAHTVEESTFRVLRRKEVD